MEAVLFAGSIVILLFSVICHEVAHGWVAKKFGDLTAQNMGRLTLNPLPHIDPIGTLLLPLLLILSGSQVLFGWAKPVPVNPFNFDNIRKGEFWTSAAGVLANLGLAVTSALLIHLLTNLNLPLLVGLLFFAVKINLALATFNLIPLPPLDGSKILASYLPVKYANQFQVLEKYGPIILIFLILSPINFIWSIINFFTSLFLIVFRLI